MRINPIMAKSQNLSPKNSISKKSPTQNINFGKIADKKTEKLTYDLMMEELEWYDEDEKQDPDSGYKEDKDYVQKKLDYFKASSLFTLKSKKDTLNNDVLYVVMHKDETDKHEHKELFDEMMQEYKDFYSSAFHAPDAQQAGLPGDEKEFLGILETDSSIDGFYREMQLREQGKRPEPPKPTSTDITSSGSSVTKSYEQEHEERKDFLIYGSL